MYTKNVNECVLITNQFIDQDSNISDKIAIAAFASLHVMGEATGLFIHLMDNDTIEIKSLYLMEKILQQNFPNNIIDWKATFLAFEQEGYPDAA